MDRKPNSRAELPSGRFIHRLNWIYAVLCCAMLLFMGLALWYRPQPVYLFPVGQDVFLYSVPVLCILGYFFGGYAFRMLVESLKPEDPVSRKAARYQSASLIRYGCLEIPALLALYAYMKQGYFFFLFIGALLIVYQISIWPTKKRIQGQLPPYPKENET